MRVLPQYIYVCLHLYTHIARWVKCVNKVFLHSNVEINVKYKVY